MMREEGKNVLERVVVWSGMWQTAEIPLFLFVGESGHFLAILLLSKTLIDILNFPFNFACEEGGDFEATGTFPHVSHR